MKQGAPIHIVAPVPTIPLVGRERVLVRHEPIHRHRLVLEVPQVRRAQVRDGDVVATGVWEPIVDAEVEDGGLTGRRVHPDDRRRLGVRPADDDVAVRDCVHMDGVRVAF